MKNIKIIKCQINIKKIKLISNLQKNKKLKFAL